MKALLIVASVAILAGCAHPPAPPAVEGSYRPVNGISTAPANTTVPRVFDFDYKGTLPGALAALTAKQPRMRLEPDRNEGIPSNIAVEVELRQVTLSNALQAIARATNGRAEVIEEPDFENRSSVVYIRYVK